MSWRAILTPQGAASSVSRTSNVGGQQSEAIDVNDRSAEELLAEVLPRAFGASGTASRIPAGTSTDNFVVESGRGERWFAKVYHDHRSLAQEQDAIDLAMYARAGGVPVPAVRRDAAGSSIVRSGDIALSLWEYVEGAETAEGGLAGERWGNVGAVLGRLHRRLATHPDARPSTRPAVELCDMPEARLDYDRIIVEYTQRHVLDEDQAWALDAALHRRSLLPRVQSMLEHLPPLTVQILHGDRAAPNLMMRGDDVAAVIDFQPPSPHHLAWEIARIGCDPRTIVRNSEWLTGLARLLEAYEQENPTVQSDMRSIVAAGCAYTRASTYPLKAPLQAPAVNHAGLMEYGRVRHIAALEMLDSLNDGTL